ncbi:Clp protease N-terminal domain-containing protein [Hyphomicrobium sp. MC8b]|uniref:Clp protease N-terminal domain-containing protein n=1 Tax=Hyphomicrobium sp. MC8b TaxID=300273 RepID=UPI00391C3984
MTAPDITQIPMSSELAATLARGAEFAGATGASEVSLEHLLAALCDDPDAVAVLDASHISGERIKGDVISRVLEGTPSGAPPQDSLGVSAEVRRILEAAAAAARGSRRRDINGAIVLAAIVGDARSVAAEILEAHGLTFENAIRALQAALNPPREAPAPPQQPQPPVADDVLARARERVQSRSAPSLRDIMKDMPRHPLSERSDPLPVAPPSAHDPSPQAAFPEQSQHPDPIPAPPFPQTPAFDGPFGREASSGEQGEPIGPPAPHSFDAGPGAEPHQAEPLRPSPAAAEPAPMPSRPFSAPSPASQEPRLPTGVSEPRPEPRHEPSFGGPTPASDHGPGQGAGPRPGPGMTPSGPGQITAPAPYPREPSLPLPSRQQPGSGAPPQGPQAFPSPYQPAGGQQSATPGPTGNPGAAPPHQRGMFDLPPRPQPSSVQPPPIPAPGLGGPASGRTRPEGPAPMQGGSPQFGPPGPSLSPTGPMGAHPMSAPGAAPAPIQGQRPNLGQDTVFRPGAPIGAPTAPQSPAPPQAQRRAPAPKRGKGANVETGQLAENIPRSMRVGKTVRAEIRIAKSSVKALTEGLDGGGQVWQHTVAVTKAMSVRIRAPDGGFYIESTSPETQWIESNLGYSSDDFASWRFNITPQYRGWSDLQIIVSARSIGADGVAAETALPDQIVEVKVRANIGRTVVRIFSWTVAAVIGGALATFGESGMAIVTTLMKKFGH